MNSNLKIAAKFSKVLPAEQVLSDPSLLTEYAADKSAFSANPSCLLLPENAAQLSEIVKLAVRENISLVARGGGTGMCGAAVPIDNGVVISFAKMNRLIALDAVNHFAVVQPGLINWQLNKILAKNNLFFPPDPSSIKECTIGGNVATAAGGPRTIKYGATRNYILGMEVCLASGQLLRLAGPTHKRASGYDLYSLMIGSEGTLALFTELTLKLLPKPRLNQTMLVSVASESEAFLLINKLRQLPDCLSCCEYLDKNSISCIAPELRQLLNRSLPESLLILEIDGNYQSQLQNKSEEIEQLLGELPETEIIFAKDQRETEALWEIRRAISPALKKLKPDKINEDICLAPSLMPQALRYIRRLCREKKLINANFGHAGDGNIHLNIMFDQNDPREKKAAFAAVRQILVEVLRRGGTISGEHGIGLSKKPYLDLEISTEQKMIWQQIKNIFDPQNIFNPGKIF